MNEKTEMTTEQVSAEKAAMEKEYLEHIKYLEAQVEWLKGMIEGLKFSIRCNGVSGGDVG